MRPRSSPLPASALAAVLAIGAPTALAAPALVVAPAAETPALRAALVEGSLPVLTEAETAKVLASAANSGVVCAPDDVACWQAVATLAGHDDVVILTATEVVSSSRAGVRRTSRLVAGVDGVRGAVLRHLGRVGGVVVRIQPASATVTIGGVPLSGGVADGLPPGPVAVSAAADGFVSRSESVVVIAGDVARVDWTLEAPAAAAAGGGFSPVLFWGGLSTVGVGAVTGVAIAGINFQANCRFDDASETGIFCRDDGNGDHQSVRNVDYAAIAIGVGLSAVGAGAAVASLFVE